MNEAHVKHQQKWCQKYYEQLVGAKIVKVESVIDDEMGWPEVWTRIHAESATGEQIVLEISRDEEGNGPGFLFGLPHVEVK